MRPWGVPGRERVATIGVGEARDKTERRRGVFHAAAIRSLSRRARAGRGPGGFQGTDAATGSENPQGRPIPAGAPRDAPTPFAQHPRGDPLGDHGGAVRRRNGRAAGASGASTPNFRHRRHARALPHRQGGVAAPDANWAGGNRRRCQDYGPTRPPARIGADAAPRRPREHEKPSRERSPPGQQTIGRLAALHKAACDGSRTVTTLR